MVNEDPGKRAVLLDRDGTINRDVGFTHRVEDLELLPRAAAGLARMAALGYRLIVTTNQSGIARGMFTEDDMHAFNEALCQRLLQKGVTIEAVYYCPFHPTEGRGDYRRASTLRKPSDGMLRLAAAEHGLDLAACFAVGDKKADVAAGQAAGCRTILMRTGAAGGDDQPLVSPPEYVADDLLDAARYIEKCPTPRKSSPDVPGGSGDRFAGTQLPRTRD
jgi:D-glycero-D-manno-heptose 1,7-bisphosphate phosphatase